jgi:hypothetical protein
MGATFAFTDSYVANLRQTDDPLNGAAGGCAAGLLAGVRGAQCDYITRRHVNVFWTIARSIPMALASCAVLGAMVGTFDASGGSLMGDGRDREAPLTREERRRRFFKHEPPVSATPLPSDL